MTRRPFPWEFHQGKKVLRVPVSGRLVMNDGMSYLVACGAGLGVAQILDWRLDELAETKGLVNLFPTWADEYFPLYVYYLSRHHSPAKVGAFIDFVRSLVTDEWKQGNPDG